MEQTKYDVFISYSRKDYVDAHKNVIPGNEVSKIKDALKESGVTYWFDEDGVYSGDAFAEKIVRSIKASRVFVFLSTYNSNQSEWTASEISTANMLKKTIIPVRIDDSVYHDSVILYLSRLSHVDYHDNPEKGLEELVRSIKSYMNEDKGAEGQKLIGNRLDCSMIFSKVRAILVDKLGVEPDDVTEDSNFEIDFDMDSLDLIEVVMELENEFSININEDMISEISTVKQVVDSIVKMKSNDCVY